MGNNKVIIIKLKSGCQPIEYFENSYNKVGTQSYYNINEEDCDYFAENLKVNETYRLVAIIYDNSNKLFEAYLGSGDFIKNSKGYSLLLNIKIKSNNNHNSFKNICKLTALNLETDFKETAYASIEKSKILSDQISFIINEPVPYKPKDATYPVLDSDEKLNKLAQKNSYCRRMFNYREPMKFRNEYQRDYERIVHSKAFRRMVDKAQIFSSSKGDYYRTRMTHSQAVDQIARGIAEGLALNPSLTEAIALGHDIGHTPFGHQGERTLDDILRGKYDIIVDVDEYNDSECLGGFKHNYQSLRVASLLEEEYFEIYGMDLSYQTLEGMLKHTSLKKDMYNLSKFIQGDRINEELRFDSDVCSTLEGQVVAIADEIAQRGHDLDDALSSSSITLNELKDYLSLRKTERVKEILDKIDELLESSNNIGHMVYDESELKNSRLVSLVISYFINDVIDSSRIKIDNYDEKKFTENGHAVKEQLICFSDEALTINNYLETIITSKVINNAEVSLFDSNAATMIKSLFKAYYNNPRLLHKASLRRLYISIRQACSNVVDFEFGDYKVIGDEFKKMTKVKLCDFRDDAERKEYKLKRELLVRTICDYISGMTDTYAIKEFNKIAKEF